MSIRRISWSGSFPHVLALFSLPHIDTKPQLHWPMCSSADAPWSRSPFLSEYWPEGSSTATTATALKRSWTIVEDGGFLSQLPYGAPEHSSRRLSRHSAARCPGHRTRITNHQRNQKQEQLEHGLCTSCCGTLSPPPAVGTQPRVQNRCTAPRIPPHRRRPAPPSREGEGGVLHGGQLQTGHLCKATGRRGLVLGTHDRSGQAVNKSAWHPNRSVWVKRGTKHQTGLLCLEISYVIDEWISQDFNFLQSSFLWNLPSLLHAQLAKCKEKGQRWAQPSTSRNSAFQIVSAQIWLCCAGGSAGWLYWLPKRFT